MKSLVRTTTLVILFLLILTFLISSCKKCEDEYRTCTSDQLKWLCYYGHETLIFRRNDGLLDTLITSERDFDFLLMHSGLHDNYHCAEYGQDVSVTASGKQIRFTLESTTYDNARIYLDTGVIFGMRATLPQNNIIINGVSYNDIYITYPYDTSQFTTLSYPKMYRAYFSKYYGMLRMDCTKGLYWEKIN